MAVNKLSQRHQQGFGARCALASGPRAVLFVAVLAVLGGCAVGPDFRSPVLPEGAGYRADALPAETASANAPTGDAQRFLEGSEVPAQWWKYFANEELNRRVEQALVNSPSIASAQAALLQAQENAGVVRGAMFPSVDGKMGGNRQSTSVNQAGASASPYTIYNTSVELGYTLDVFGGVRRAVEAESAIRDYQRYQLEATYLSLAANVVTTSIREAALRGQIKVTEEIADIFQQQSDLINLQYETGVKSQGDVLFAESQVATARAQLPILSKALAQTQTQLAVYLGQFPQQAEFAALELDALSLPLELPVSLPSTLVRVRPDVAAAEAQLHEASARVGISTANLFPDIRLSAAFGSEALSGSDLFGSGSEAWSLGLNLLQPIFQGGSLRARKRAAEAGLDQAAADYRSSVLSAFQNVADSLRALEFDAEAVALQAAAQQATASSLELSQKQYNDGSVAFLQVLIETRQYQQAQLALIDARATRLADTAALYAALGGGFGDDSLLAANATGANTPQADARDVQDADVEESHQTETAVTPTSVAEPTPPKSHE